ncbi:MAG: YggT family protein [Alphaproteobacteria bacterium]|nr:YggT family protein [Alphaproteobacteria bacterium]HCQ70589.1 YggT family protein [Rhodospirillaceae bacterium]|tara:strand:+ start:35148 stop:35426 length:279 start_codon:yes stop_codon:yes gene_type:complete
MGLFVYIIDLAFNIAYFIIMAQVALHWLTIFGVINTQNEQAQKLVGGLEKLTEPVYSKIRQYVPAIGGIDLTPLVALIGLSFARYILISILI